MAILKSIGKYVLIIALVKAFGILPLVAYGLFKLYQWFMTRGAA